MSHENPTALRIGASGMLDGRRYVVRGRVVLSVEIDGDDYFWNEFNLVDASGNCLTLVYEEEEAGPTWKLFEYFEPLRPISATEARNKRVGDTIDIDGRNAQISLVDESTVRHVEGEAPEGVQLGDVAQFFNAEGGDDQVVVSWTGDEVEYYRGRDTTARRIEAAFGLEAGSAEAPLQTSFRADADGQRFRPTTLIVVAAAVVIVGFAVFSCTHGRQAPPPPPKQAAGARQLAPGARGGLAGETYSLDGHAWVEIGRVGRRFERHEYALAASGGSRALLINALAGDARAWHLFSPVEPPIELNAFDAAALRAGRSVTVGGRTMQVNQLFLTRILGRDGPSGAALWPAALHYGFVASAPGEWLLARWDENAIQLFRGQAVAERDVMMAFDAAPAPTR